MPGRPITALEIRSQRAPLGSYASPHNPDTLGLGPMPSPRQPSMGSLSGSPLKRLSPRQPTCKKKTGCLCWKKSRGQSSESPSPRRRPMPPHISSLEDLNRQSQLRSALRQSAIAQKNNSNKYRTTVSRIINDSEKNAIQNFDQVTGNLEGEHKEKITKTFMHIEWIRRGTLILKKLFTLVYVLNLLGLCLYI